MSLTDLLKEVDPVVAAVGTLLTAGVGWWGMASRAWRRERVARIAERAALTAERVALAADEAKRWDSASNANERLFDYLEPRLADFERRCAACEHDKIEMRAEFTAEIKLMQAQYVERITALTAEIKVLRTALRAAGLPVPSPPLITGALFDDDPAG